MLLFSKKHIQQIFFPFEIKILEILLLMITSRLHSSIIIHKNLLRIKGTLSRPKGGEQINKQNSKEKKKNKYKRRTK